MGLCPTMAPSTPFVQRPSFACRINQLPARKNWPCPGNWRKRKGIARIRLENGAVRLAELHWYEAHGIGRRELKRKRYLDRK